jgi:hypothetical protein
VRIDEPRACLLFNTQFTVNCDRRLKHILEVRDAQALLELWPNSDDARRAHPTRDHFLPIIYTYATTGSRDVVRFPIEGFDRSVSMRAIMYHHKTE